MPIDPISWLIIAAVAVTVAVEFWDEIKAWASQVLGRILDAINDAIEVASDGIVYLVKEGTRIYKRIEVFVRNVRSGGTRVEYRQEEISKYDIPDEILADLDKKQKLKLMQSQA